MSGIDLILMKKNIENQAEIFADKEKLIFEILNKNLIQDQQIMFKNYNFVLENVKIINTIFLIFFEKTFKTTGCPDLVLKSVWIIFCIVKKTLKSQQANIKNLNYDKILIDLIYAKLNLFFELEDSTNYFKNYFYLSKEGNLSKKEDSSIYNINKEKKLLDIIFNKIFKLNSVLDFEMNKNYFDLILSIKNHKENINQIRIEDITSSLNDTCESIFIKNKFFKNNIYKIELPLNEEEDLNIQNLQSKNIQQTYSKIKCFVDKNIKKNIYSSCITKSQTKLNYFNIFPNTNNANLTFNNRLNHSSISNIENIEMLSLKDFPKEIEIERNTAIDNNCFKNSRNKFKIIDFDYARILLILRKFYTQNYLEGDLDDLYIYENINLDKFLDYSRNARLLSNSNSSNSFQEFKLNHIQSHDKTRKRHSLNNYSINAKYNQFIQTLNDYNYNDINYFIKKYNLKFYYKNINAEEFTYCSIYDNFYYNFLQKNEFLKKNINQIKSSFDKNIFLKILDDFISKGFLKFIRQKLSNESNKQYLEEEINNKNSGNSKHLKHFSFSEYFYSFGFDKDFFDNLFIVSYYIYLNLLLIENSHFDDFILNFINNLTKFKNVHFHIIFYIIDNLNKVNYSSPINRILKNLNNLIISLAILKRDSYMYKNILNRKENNFNYDINNLIFFVFFIRFLIKKCLVML